MMKTIKNWGSMLKGHLKDVYERLKRVGQPRLILEY